MISTEWTRCTKEWPYLFICICQVNWGLLMMYLHCMLCQQILLWNALASILMLTVESLCEAFTYFNLYAKDCWWQASFITMSIFPNPYTDFSAWCCWLGDRKSIQSVKTSASKPVGMAVNDGGVKYKEPCGRTQLPTSEAAYEVFCLSCEWLETKDQAATS